MDKEDRAYLMQLIRERLRGWIEIPPDKVLKEIVYDMWDEIRIILDRQKQEAYIRK